MGIERPWTEASAADNLAFYKVVADGYPDTGGYDPTAIRPPSPDAADLLIHYAVDMGAVEEPKAYEF